MATKIQDAIVAMANGIINYVDFKVDNATFVRTEIGKVKYVTTINGKYTHIVTIRNYDYGGVLSLGNNEFPADSVVYVLVPNGQYNQMFILGYLDDTDAHIKGGSINLGNGNFTVDNSGIVTIKKGSINLGNGNFTVDNNGSVTIKSGSITLGNNFSVTSSGVVTIKSGSINLGNNFIVDSSGTVTIKTGSINLGSGNFIVDNNGSVTIKSGSITLGNNFSVTSAGAVTIKSGSIKLGSNFEVTTSGYAYMDNCRFGKFYIESDGFLWYYGNQVNHYEIGLISGESGGQWGNNGIFKIGSPVGGLELYASSVYGLSIHNDWGVVGLSSLSGNNISQIILNQEGDTNHSILLNSNLIKLNSRSNSIEFSNGKISTIGQQLRFWSSGEDDYGVELGVKDSMWGWHPVKDGYIKLGTPSYRWGQIYSTSASINTSDRNQKHDINLLEDTKTKDFIMDLKPVSFKFNNGESGRLHHGLIAQDVEDTLYKLGMTPMDFAGFCKDQKMKEIEVPITDDLDNVKYKTAQEPIEGEYIYGLRYEEFIPSLIKMVQMQQKEIDKLKDKLGEK